MAYRRALATGLQRLARQIASGSAPILATASAAEAPVVSKAVPSALQFARCFAAQPAAAADAANVGRVTQVRIDFVIWCQNPLMQGLPGFTW